MFGLKGKVALAGLLIGLASPVAAQTPIFRMDCGTNGSNWPRCGWSDELTDCSEGYCSKTRIPGGSPSGRDSVRIEGRLNPGSTAQYDYGWLSSYGGINDTRPRGARYARWRIKLLSPVQWRDHIGGAAASKLVILGNGCDDRTSRIISNIGPYNGSASQSAPLDLWTARNIEGGSNEIRLMDALVADQWLNIQIMAAPGVGLSQWVNNNNQSAPNGRTTDSSISDINWRNSGCELHFGSTMAALAGLGSIRLELADFEYDDRFDPNWNIGGGGGGGGGTPTAPAAPSNVRIVTASVGLPMLGALGLLLRRRRTR